MYSFTDLKFNYYFSTVLAIVLFSMAGVPPFLGFFSKLLILILLINSNFFLFYLFFFGLLFFGLYFLTSKNFKFNEKSLKYLIKNFSNTSFLIFSSNSLWSLFDINFLRKERIYTKLKYSRTPQYDIVSGGAAALFAAFLGFLFSEKFGFELADSGDFYFLFMYLVFLFFFCRLFLKLLDANQSTWNPFSFKWLITFYRNLFIVFLNYLSYFFDLIKKKIIF